MLAMVTKKISIAKVVFRFVAGLKPGCIFSSRDVLILDGVKRNPMDIALCRLVKDGTIERLANGVFRKPNRTSEESTPPPVVIAKVKANAFERNIFTLTQTGKGVQPASSAPQDALIYATDGPTTSFNTVHGRIHFKKHAPRKIRLGDSKVGRIIRRLWELGPETTEILADEILQNLKRDEKMELKRSAALMPWWMSDQFVPKIAGTTLHDKFVPVDFKDLLVPPALSD